MLRLASVVPRAWAASTKAARFPVEEPQKTQRRCMAGDCARYRPATVRAGLLPEARARRALSTPAMPGGRSLYRPNACGTRPSAAILSLTGLPRPRRGSHCESAGRASDASLSRPERKDGKSGQRDGRYGRASEHAHRAVAEFDGRRPCWHFDRSERVVGAQYRRRSTIHRGPPAWKVLIGEVQEAASRRTHAYDDVLWLVRNDFGLPPGSRVAGGREP